MSEKNETTLLEQVELLNGFILVKEKPLEDKKTEAGLVIPKHLQEKKDNVPRWGDVLKVANDVENIKAQSKVFLIGFNLQSGEVVIDNESYRILRAKDIIMYIP